tara:strand:- start:323 stop:661 length:339 start_codon:yes stop_codon:yes gene_type:complete
MIDGYEILDKVNNEILDFKIPTYELYFYKQNNREPEKVESYSLVNLGEMNQLKINIRHIITDYSKYNQYHNYRIELIYIDYKDNFNFVATLREYEQSEDEEFLLENCVGQGR